MIDRSQRLASRVYAVTFLVCTAVIMVVFPRYYAPLLVWNDPLSAGPPFITPAMIAP